MTTANKVWKNDVYNQLKPKPPIICHKCMLWGKAEIKKKWVPKPEPTNSKK